MYICCVVFLFHFAYLFVFPRFTFTFIVLFNNVTAIFEETLSFALLKLRKKWFVLCRWKFSLIKYIQYKKVQVECGEPFPKKFCLFLCSWKNMLFFFRKILVGCFVYFPNVIGWIFSKSATSNREKTFKMY